MDTPTVAELAQLIDHTILHPKLGEEDLRQTCDEARRYGVASVCVKPYMVASAREQLADSDVRVGCVVGFPAGIQTILVKVYETEDACRNGAQEIDMVINIARALEEDWDYLREEIGAVKKACTAHGASLKIIFETDYVDRPDHIRKLCEICTEVGAEYVKTSTGFGFSKGEDGKYSYVGATRENLELMVASTGAGTQVKASGAVRDLDKLLMVREVGCKRCGATATVSILEEAKKRFG
jgi:deoxyribose-phosphate aldolase